MAAAIPSPQSPPEPGRGDDLARQERKIELSRLRNEGGGDDLVHIRTDRGLWRPKAEGYTNDKHDAGQWVRSEAEDMTRHLGPEKSLQLIPVAASPSDLPAREAIEDLRTHRESWREALVKARDTADQRLPDTDDKGYWQHELDAFDRTFAALQPLSQGNGEAVGVEMQLRRQMLEISEHAGAHLCRAEKAEKELAELKASQPEGVWEALDRSEVEFFSELKRRTPFENALIKAGYSRELAESTVSILADASLLTTTPSRGLVEAAEWQPIETAPKDETPFIGYLGGLKIPYFICWWAKASVRTGKPFICILGIGELYNVELNPTHWMPLPAPPRTLSAKPTAP